MTFKARTHGAAPRDGASQRSDGARRPPPGMPRYLRPGAGTERRALPSVQASVRSESPASARPDAGVKAAPAAGPAALPVSRPGDACERNADAAAHRLAEAPSDRGPVAVGAAPSSPAGSAAASPQATAAAAPGTARPLPASLAVRYGDRLGHDLSGVKVHADGPAAEAARAAGARAYTVGDHVVFGAGEYAPGTPHGDRLIAHEAAHVVQQARGGAPSLMRQPAPGGTQQPPQQQPAPAAPAPTGLDAMPAATKQSLKVDTDEAKGSGANPSTFFGLKGDITTASNVDIDYDLVTPGIDALKDDKVKSGLYKGLRGYALGVFDLLPDPDSGKATTTRLNLVHHANLDLTPWGGPDTEFRFTAVGSTAAGNKIKVKVTIEQLAARFVPLSASATGVEAAKATPSALTKSSTMADATWQRVLRALDRMPAATLSRLRDVEFDTSADDRGGDGEAAEYVTVWKDNKWTRRIILYADIRKAGDEAFGFTLIHEVAHALDFAPSETAKGPDATKELHRDKAFQDALAKDGGRSKAVTSYGAKSDKELYAECFALYTQRPATLKALRPNLFAYFEATFGGQAPAAPTVTAPTAGKP